MNRVIRPVAATALVLGMALILTPSAVPVWTTAYIPAANRVHYGDALIVLMVLAGFGLYIAVSLLQTRRRLPAGDYITGNVYVIGAQMDPDFIPPSTSLNPDAAAAPYSPAGSPTGVAGLSRPGTDAAGVVLTSPGPTPAATTAAAVPRGAAADGTHTRAVLNARPAFPASRPVEEEAAGRGVTPGGAA